MLTTHHHGLNDPSRISEDLVAQVLRLADVQGRAPGLSSANGSGARAHWRRAGSGLDFPPGAAYSFLKQECIL